MMNIKSASAGQKQVAWPHAAEHAPDRTAERGAGPAASHPTGACPTLARAAAGWLLALAAGLAGAQTGPQPRLPTVDLGAGMHLIKAELAVTSEQQAIGMMGRKQMGANEGMLFVNGDDQLRCFWMRNTLIPLSIAFLTADGTVINVAEMQPLSDQSHCSTRPARFALEMNAGWFAKRGIGPGSKLRGPPFGNPR